MPQRKPTVNAQQTRRYLNYLKEQERSAATLSKYAHDLAAFRDYLQDTPLTKAALIDWKTALSARYAPASVNSMLTVVNGYLRFMGWATLCVKLIKVQRSLFLDEKKELTRAEYARLVHAAQQQDNERLRLRQVIINLLSNAIKYTPDRGRILFEVSELESKDREHAVIQFSVKDTGCGMTQEFLAKIFDPFTRAENSTTNKIQGTGLGMAITKKIVDLMGGAIEVESKINRGSTFIVTLPMEIDKTVKVELPCKQVLAVSDHEDFIENVLAAFRGAEAMVRIARTEAQTDQLLAEGNTDVVLLGSCLEGRTLEENLRGLREKAKGALLIYCCEYAGQEQLGGLGEKGGVDGMVERPIFLSTLAQALEQAKGNLPERNEDDGSGLKGMRFLCAEDNVLNAEILSAIMDMNGATCVIYPNGQALVEAFASVKPEDFDAILMDIQMPVMNGLDATRAIRCGENPLGATIPIIAMTANAFSEDVQACLEAGMNAHVAKPLDIAVLTRTLRNVLGGKFSGRGHLYADRRQIKN